MRLALALLAATAVAGLAGCYRLASPPGLGETVRLEIVGNKGRLVRSQGYLTDAVARALVQRLGWRVGPQGTATLQLAIAEEDISAHAHDRQDLTSSWTIRINGTMLLVARGGSLTGTFTGVGNTSGLASTQGEPEALQDAAEQAADDLVTFLDVRARDLVPPAAKQ